MKFKNILASLCLLALSTTASAGLITFDDVPSGSIQNSYGDVGQYAGYDFSVNLDWIDLVDYPWNFGTVSGDFAMLNNNAGVGNITATDDSDFYFGGLWAKKWGTGIDSGGSDSLFGYMRGLNDGQIVWEVSTALNGSYKNFAAQNIAIDELQLGFGNYFLVDNLTLSSQLTPSTEVPEPSSLAILGLGLLGLVRFRKKA